MCMAITSPLLRIGNPLNPMKSHIGQIYSWKHLVVFQSIAVKQKNWVTRLCGREKNNNQYPPVANQRGPFLIQETQQILPFLHILGLRRITTDETFTPYCQNPVLPAGSWMNNLQKISQKNIFWGNYQVRSRPSVCVYRSCLFAPTWEWIVPLKTGLSLKLSQGSHSTFQNFVSGMRSN